MAEQNTDEPRFSLFDFLLKKTQVSQVYDPSCLDDNGDLIDFSTQAAIVTHYVQQYYSAVDYPYCKRGEKIVNLWNSIATELPVVNNCAAEPLNPLMGFLFKDFHEAKFKAIANPKFKFIDLFAGIGGFRISMQNCGGECVFSSEWDENAKQTYFHNFGEVPFGDITKEQTKSFVPDNFDVLCAGFPCQAFSIAGYRRGFEDTRGTLFFDVAEILKRKKPKAVYLENVKNLYTHDDGKTFQVIKNTLEEIGYVVYHKVMNAMEYANVPQNRERIFIVCFDPQQVPNHADFTFPEKEPLTRTIHDCIDDRENDPALFYTEKMSHIDELRKGILSKDSIYQWRRQYVRENKSSVCPTLTANMGTGGHNVPLILTDKGIRKLSPKECINFQGYPAEYSFPSNIANSAKYKQAGNSVVVPLIEKVCRQIVDILFPNS